MTVPIDMARLVCLTMFAASCSETSIQGDVLQAPLDAATIESGESDRPVGSDVLDASTERGSDEHELDASTERAFDAAQCMQKPPEVAKISVSGDGFPDAGQSAGLSLTGTVVASTTNSITIDTCTNDGGCAMSRFTLQVDAPGLVLGIPSGYHVWLTFVHGQIFNTDCWGEANRLLIADVLRSENGGATFPGDPVLVVENSNCRQPLSPSEALTVTAVDLDCGNPRKCRDLVPQALQFNPRGAWFGAPVLVAQGESATFTLRRDGRMASFGVHNLPSYGEYRPLEPMCHDTTGYVGYWVNRVIETPDAGDAAIDSDLGTDD